eukprot:4657790-Prymnesium_polylepis.2
MMGESNHVYSTVAKVTDYESMRVWRMSATERTKGCIRVRGLLSETCRHIVLSSARCAGSELLEHSRGTTVP